MFYMWVRWYKNNPALLFTFIHISLSSNTINSVFEILCFTNEVLGCNLNWKDLMMTSSNGNAYCNPIVHENDPITHKELDVLKSNQRVLTVIQLGSGDSIITFASWSLKSPVSLLFFAKARSTNNIIKTQIRINLSSVIWTKTASHRLKVIICDFSLVRISSGHKTCDGIVA